ARDGVVIRLLARKDLLAVSIRGIGAPQQQTKSPCRPVIVEGADCVERRSIGGLDRGEDWVTEIIVAIGLRFGHVRAGFAEGETFSPELLDLGAMDAGPASRRVQYQRGIGIGTLGTRDRIMTPLPLDQRPVGIAARGASGRGEAGWKLLVVLLGHRHAAI